MVRLRGKVIQKFRKWRDWQGDTHRWEICWDSIIAGYRTLHNWASALVSSPQAQFNKPSREREPAAPKVLWKFYFQRWAEKVEFLCMPSAMFGDNYERVQLAIACGRAARRWWSIRNCWQWRSVQSTALWRLWTSQVVKWSHSSKVWSNQQSHFSTSRKAFDCIAM